MKKKRNQRFAVSPYLFQLIILGMCGVLLCTGLTIYFLHTQSYCSVQDFLSKDWPSVIVVLCPLLVFLTVCICNSYEFFGKILIDDSQVICYAPFRKSLFFEYSEIREIGVDYAWLSVNKQYWIYLSSEKIDKKYWHKINRMPINQIHLRIQFSENVYNTLLQHLPNDLKKSLCRSKTEDVSDNVNSSAR